MDRRRAFFHRVVAAIALSFLMVAGITAAITPAPADAAGCVGFGCWGRDPDAMNCGRNDTRESNTLGSVFRYLQVRVSNDCDAGWVRGYSRSHNNYGWGQVYSSNSKSYLDTDNMAEGISRGLVGKSSTQAVEGWSWGNMVPHYYLRLCYTSHGGLPSYPFQWGQDICIAYRYISTNPYYNDPGSGPR